MHHPATRRLQGLDTLRACAIVLVLLTHYASFVSRSPTFGALGDAGWSGVTLFFVLSGYLIGNQLLAPLARGAAWSFKTFFARRLLRTLPNYYAVLAVYLLFPHGVIGGKTTAPPWQFLSFTQNLWMDYGQTFSHSWSLCIEEQFYLVLPLALLALARGGFRLRLAWCLLAGAFAFGMEMRAVAWLAQGLDTFSAPVYYGSVYRFGEMLPGVAIALLKNFHPAAFARILRHANALLAAGLALAAGALVCVDEAVFSPLLTTGLVFPLTAVAFGLLVCAALAPDCLLNRVRVPGAASLALWSYAIYLVHKMVFMALRPQLEAHGIDSGAPLVILAVMAGAVACGWLLYRLVELPFMRLRERWVPAQQAPAAPADPLRSLRPSA